MMSIPHNRLSVGVEEEAAAIRVLRSGWLAQGTEVEAFESEMCDYLGLPHGHAVAVSSGTAALYLALRVLNVQGTQIACPVYSCSALTNAIAMSGGHEVFIDTMSDSPNVNLDELIASGVTMAIIPHMFGLPVDLSTVDKHIVIIEDCAQALGAVVNGIPAGLQGEIGIFSFYATKLMTSGGQGGMLISRNRALVDCARDYRQFDCRSDRNRRFNFQMTDIQAAIGRVQLGKLPHLLLKRAKIFDRYQHSGIDMVDAPMASDCSPVRYRGVMRTTCQSETISTLKLQGVNAIVPIGDWELLDTPEAHPNACRFSRGTVSLPLYPSLTDEQVETVISAVINR